MRATHFPVVNTSKLSTTSTIGFELSFFHSRTSSADSTKTMKSSGWSDDFSPPAEQWKRY